MIKVFVFIVIVNFSRGDANKIEIRIIPAELKNLKDLFEDNDARKHDSHISLCSTSESIGTVYDSLPSINDTTTNFIRYTSSFCKNGIKLTEFRLDEVKILNNGSVSTRSTGTVFNTFQYCLQKSERDIWKAYICVSIIKIPRCCFMDVDGRSRCDDVENKFDPTVNLNKFRIEIDSKKDLLYSLDCSNITSEPLDELTIFSVQNNKIAFVNNGSASTTKFCIDNKEGYLIKFCDPKEKTYSPCQEGKCLRKCCPDFQIYDSTKKSCVMADRKYLWSPTLFNKINLNESVIIDNLTFLHGFPECKLRMSLSSNDKYFALTNGQLYVTKYADYYSTHQYCIDHFMSGDRITESVILCFPNGSSKSRFKDCKNVHVKLYPSFMIVSCFFLSLTVLVYSILPEMYSKVNGKCVIASAATLIGAFICLICIQWASSKIRPLSCQTLGLFSQYFSLSSIFWLNVMCFDVWRALRSHRSSAGRSAYSVNLRFIKYSIYAWGCPMIISCVTALMQFNEQIQANNYLVTPGLGKTGCFFPKNDPKPFWTYFYGFILALMISNTFFFVHLLLILHKERIQNDSDLHRRSKGHFMWMKLYLKLFCVMGITFLFDILSWIEGTCKIWIWTDSINALRGFLIFGIFVCKKEIYVKLKNSSILSMNFFQMSLVRSSSNKNADSESPNSRFYVSSGKTKSSSV